MLHIILLILKIIGITLLVIVGIVLLAVLLLLFVPVRYKAGGSFVKTEKSFDARGRACVSWLLHFVSFRFIYDNGIGYILRVLGIVLIRGGICEKKRKKKDKKSEVEEEAKPETPDEDVKPEANEGEKPKEKPKEEKTEEEKPEEANEEVKPEAKEEKQGGEESSAKETDKPESEEAEEAEDEEKKSGKSQESVVKKIKNIYNKVTGMIEDKRVQAAWELVKKQIVRLFNAIVPRHAKGHFYYGFEDPSLTGYLTALLASQYGRLSRLDMEPFFEEEVLDADMKISGRIFGISILTIAAKLYFNKNIRYTIDKVNALKDESNS